MRLVSTLLLLAALAVSGAVADPGCSGCCSCGSNSDADVLTPGGAVSNDGGPVALQPQRGQTRSNPARVIERLDTDGNGTLEVSELPATERGQALAAGDTDGDGIVSTDEIAALMQQRGLGGPPENAPQGPPPQGRRRNPFSAEDIIERLDANGDGTLQVDELPEGQRGSRLAAADLNEDGVIASGELTAHMSAIRGEGGRRQRGPAAGQPASGEASSD